MVNVNGYTYAPAEVCVLCTFQFVLEFNKIKNSKYSQPQLVRQNCLLNISITAIAYVIPWVITTNSYFFNRSAMIFQRNLKFFEAFIDALYSNSVMNFWLDNNSNHKWSVFRLILYGMERKKSVQSIVISRLIVLCTRESFYNLQQWLSVCISHIVIYFHVMIASGILIAIHCLYFFCVVCCMFVVRREHQGKKRLRGYLPKLFIYTGNALYKQECWSSSTNTQMRQHQQLCFLSGCYVLCIGCACVQWGRRTI